MSTINFLTPGFNKAGQNNLDNQGGLIGPENDPVINALVTILHPQELLIELKQKEQF